MSSTLNGSGNTKNIPPIVRPRLSSNSIKSGQTQTKFGQHLSDSVQALKNAAAPKLEPIQENSLRIKGTSSAIAENAEKSFSDILKVVLKHEGRGYVKLDAMRESSKMGILQSTARENGYAGDIKDLTSADAEKIYYKIWQKSGAAKLPYPLNMIHFDTYVNSPAAARKILAKSDGNIDTYLDMRSQRYRRLVTARPEKYARYLKGWMNRISHLKQMATDEYARTNEVRTGKAVRGLPG
ncbi:MAG: hypothetical protein C0402_12935 [Thermodesulfovibrio sp.]|nr:hypothetical protein [Thermodesulfovibrio sp.]